MDCDQYYTAFDLRVILFNATIVFAILLAAVTLSAIMYVDDTNLLFFGDINDTTTTLAHNDQTMVKKW